MPGRIVASLVGLGGLFGVGSLFYSQFTQARNIVNNLAYSRLMLAALYVILALMFWVVVGQLVRTRWLALSLSTVLPLVIVVGLDWWAPKPESPTRVQARSVPSLDTSGLAKETAQEVSKLLAPPTIRFNDQRSIIFRHGLNASSVQISCYDLNGHDLRTWDGPKIVDENTVRYDWSEPKSGSCSAIGSTLHAATVERPPQLETSLSVAPNTALREHKAAVDNSRIASSQSRPAIGSVTVQGGGAASIGQQGGITVGQININREPTPTPVVPEISLVTSAGLSLSDFSSSMVSAEMMQHLRRNDLTITNPNVIDLQDFVLRFQLPEPVLGNLIIEDRPAGVEIIWHACRISLSLVGDGASASALPGGGTKISTGEGPGRSAVLSGGGEVCSATMDKEGLALTGLYQLRIQRLPARTTIRLAFLTTNGPESSSYCQASEMLASEDPTVLRFYGHGSIQFLSGTHTESMPIYLPLQFNKQLRKIVSLPSSTERGKWVFRRLMAAF